MTSTEKSYSSDILGFGLDGKIQYSSHELLTRFRKHGTAENVFDLFGEYPVLSTAAKDAIEGKAAQCEIKLNDRYFLVEMRRDFPLIKNYDIVALFSDITSIKKKEAALKAKITQLSESNKELEQFAYVTSHDLNEPLRMVSNFAQLLESEYKDKLDEEAKTYFQFVIDGSQRVQYLINDLLMYNRACRAEIKAQKLIGEDIVFLQAYKLREIMEKQNVKLEIESAGKMFGDPKHIGLVFYHLIKNAIQYNNSKPPTIHISIVNRKKHDKIEIRDNGLGIPNEHESTVFEILKRVNTRPDLDGSGVGLAICKKLINLHGGKIWFESELGKGTTFHFTLPKNQEKTVI